ncbi:ATP-binding cassette domain-containing protein [Paenibacillus sp. GYB004]|uniref:metal ABC transporter ATP-binding protein n=1 Tax=Paenibacillus sp. GYB004 TaxID=2994393 RepID=UPI002F96BBE9
MEVSVKEEFAIEMSRFTGGYSRNPILQQITFRIKAGEAVAVVGENGAGKTTFFRAILQLLPVHSGSMAIMGREIRSKRDKRWARSMIGYVPQTHGTGKFPISAEDAVLLGRWGTSFGFGRRPSKQDVEMAGDMLERVGLTAMRQTDCRLLSGGQRQRLNIARALVRKPKILLLDEPTTYLDEDSRNMLNALIDEVRHDSRTTVITITHLKEEAMLMSDRVVHLKNGNLYTAAGAEEAT